jgi:hypothetical protein
MNAEHDIGKQEHNRQVDEEEFEKMEKVKYFEDLINDANNLRKLAEAKIIQTQSKKLETITNKLDSQIQSIGELIRKAETKREEAINKVLDAEVTLIMVENKILHSKVKNY